MKPIPVKKPGACFHCGKPGHYSRECRSRLAAEKVQQPQVNPLPALIKIETPIPSQPEHKREVTCFNCRQKGHKSPQYPLKTNQVKKINIPTSKIVPLARNEVFGSMGRHRLPITCDTGAQITLVPEECVEPQQFTGGTCVLAAVNDSRFEGKHCEVDITIGDKTFHRKAVTQPGKLPHWTVCLSIDLGDRQEGLFVLDQMEKRAKLPEEQALYLPPEIKDGSVISGILVSEGTVIEEEEEINKDVQPVQAHHIQEVEPEVQPVPRLSITNTVVEETERETVVGDKAEGVREECNSVLVDEKKVLVEVEEEGDSSGGSAGERVQENLSVEGIRKNIPRTDLAQASKEDTTLTHLYNLAEQDKEEYHIEEHIIFRTRLDVFGQTIRQIYIPKPYRQQCLTLAHNHFGHQGRTKMVELIRPYFYWPNLTRDCGNHVRSCDICQKTD